jgi:hypothetical protein
MRRPRSDSPRHSPDRAQQQRRLIALEAARVMTEQGIHDFQLAKRKAAERLGIFEDLNLPNNGEIEDALREHQRLFQGDLQPQLLKRRRQVALEAMKFLERFEPRLVGAVLEGTADEHSAVCLHVFSDEPRALMDFLGEQGIPFDENDRRMRYGRDEVEECPVYLFSADDTAIDLTLMAYDRLRQAPLDRSGNRPMRRASRSAVQALLTVESALGAENLLTED